MTTKRGRTLRLAILALVAVSIAIAIAHIVAGKGFDLIDYLKKLHGGA